MVSFVDTNQWNYFKDFAERLRMFWYARWSKRFLGKIRTSQEVSYDGGRGIKLKATWRRIEFLHWSRPVTFMTQALWQQSITATITGSNVDERMRWLWNSFALRQTRNINIYGTVPSWVGMYQVHHRYRRIANWPIGINSNCCYLDRNLDSVETL